MYIALRYTLGRAQENSIYKKQIVLCIKLRLMLSARFRPIKKLEKI